MRTTELSSVATNSKVVGWSLYSPLRAASALAMASSTEIDGVVEEILATYQYGVSAAGVGMGYLKKQLTGRCLDKRRPERDHLSSIVKCNVGYSISDRNSILSDLIHQFSKS